MPTFDSRQLRQTLGEFVTGVTVITTVGRDGRRAGLTANSFSSVSLDPPLILWSQSQKAPSHELFREAERFAVNILASDQIGISDRFARGGDDKFAGVPLRTGLGGVPLIEGCTAYLECRRITSYPGGDHVVFLGEVERIERASREPLVFGGGRYMVAQPHDLGGFSLDLGVSSLARVHAARLAGSAVARLSAELDETLAVGVWGNKGPTIVRWEPARSPVSQNLRTGLVLPVCSSATGLCFAAWLPQALTSEFVQAELADADGRARAGFEEAIRSTREAGIARIVATSHFTDLYGTSINALSVPVVDGFGDIALAITAIGDSRRLDVGPEGRVATSMLRCAAELSARLGSRAPAVVGP